MSKAKELSSFKKHKILIDLVANEIKKRSKGKLNVIYRKIEFKGDSLAKQLGAHIVIDKYRKSKSLYLRVNGRGGTSKDHFSAYWRPSARKIKRTHKRLYLIFCWLDYECEKLGKLWFMPSKDFLNNKWRTPDRYKISLNGLVKKLNKLI